MDLAGEKDQQEPSVLGQRMTNRDDDELGHAATKLPQGSDVLTLNVGGKDTVETLRSTLTVVAGSKLECTFSGRWDHSLPKNEKGHFFIDREPELFLPLLSFLRDLSSITPEDVKEPLPPRTPAFIDVKHEESFRRMVDSLGLTNVLYNYEIYEHPPKVEFWNNVSIVSRQCSIFDAPLLGDAKPGRYYTLDRRSHRHARQVQSFDVTLNKNCACSIGWIRQGEVSAKDQKTFFANAETIHLHTNHRHLLFNDRQGDCHSHELRVKEIGEGTVVRCSKNRDTHQLEWFVDGVLVGLTSKSLAYGKVITVKEVRVCHLGWVAPDNCEMIPKVFVASGSCHFSALELES